jgi:hypothetical protein
MRTTPELLWQLTLQRDTLERLDHEQSPDSTEVDRNATREFEQLERDIEEQEEAPARVAYEAVRILSAARTHAFYGGHTFTIQKVTRGGSEHAEGVAAWLRDKGFEAKAVTLDGAPAIGLSWGNE